MSHLAVPTSAKADNSPEPVTVLRAVGDLRAESDYLRALLAEVIVAAQPTGGGAMLELPPDLLAECESAVRQAVDHPPVVFRVCACGCGGLR